MRFHTLVTMELPTFCLSRKTKEGIICALFVVDA